MEMDEAERAKGVGLHIRGKVLAKDGSTNEDDKARFYWHR